VLTEYEEVQSVLTESQEVQSVLTEYQEVQSVLTESQKVQSMFTDPRVKEPTDFCLFKSSSALLVALKTELESIGSDLQS